MTKKCKVCGKPRDHDNPLVSRCKKCQYEHSNNNKKQTKIKLVSNKKKERLASGGSEKQKFIEIAINRAIDGVCKCEVCGKSIRLIDLTHWNFDHEIPKSKGEEYRLNEKNIKIKCVACHFKKTTGLNLKTEYNN